MRLRSIICPVAFLAMLSVSVSVLLPCQRAEAASVWTNTGEAVSVYDIPSLAYDSVHDILYAGAAHVGTAVYGVWRCNNPMTISTWTSTGGGVSSLYITALAYDGTHDVLYAAITGSLACSVIRLRKVLLDLTEV